MDSFGSLANSCFRIVSLDDNLVEGKIDISVGDVAAYNCSLHTTGGKGFFSQVELFFWERCKVDGVLVGEEDAVAVDLV